MKSNRSMPSSQVIPVLAYSDVREAVVWLCETFGFVERLRIGDHRSQLTFGDGSIVVCAGAANSSSGISIMVRVEDVDAHYEHVKSCGVIVGGQPTSFPYGERQYSVVDLGGHHWTFSQSIEDSNPVSWGGELVG